MNRIINRIKWEICATKRYFIRLTRNIIVNSIAGSYVVPGVVRKLIYNLCGMKVATRDIFPKCFFGGTNIEVGRGTFINYGVYFDGSEKIVIKENVNIAMMCTFITSSHEIAESSHRAGKPCNQPIVVEDGCWIGGNVTVLPGVTIHKGAIIGAGSVVNKDCDSDKIYAGVPAREIRSLDCQ